MKLVWFSIIHCIQVCVYEGDHIINKVCMHNCNQKKIVLLGILYLMKNVYGPKTSLHPQGVDQLLQFVGKLSWKNSTHYAIRNIWN